MTTLTCPVQELVVPWCPMSGSGSGKTSFTFLALPEQEGVQPQAEGRKRMADDAGLEAAQQAKVACMSTPASAPPAPATQPQPATGIPCGPLPVPLAPLGNFPTLLLPTCLAPAAVTPLLPPASCFAPPSALMGAPPPGAPLAPCASASHPTAPPPVPPHSLVASLLGGASKVPAAPKPRPPAPLTASPAGAPANALIRQTPQHATLPAPQGQQTSNLATLVASNPLLLNAYLQMQRQQQQEQQQLLHKQAPGAPLQPQLQLQPTQQPVPPFHAAPRGSSSPGRGKAEPPMLTADDSGGPAPQEAAAVPLPVAPAGLRRPRSARMRPSPLRMAQLVLHLQPPGLELLALLPSAPAKNPVGRPRKHPAAATQRQGDISCVAGGASEATKAADALGNQLPVWMQGLMQPEGQQLLDQLRQQQQQQQLWNQEQQHYHQMASGASALAAPTQHRRKKFVPSRAAV